MIRNPIFSMAVQFYQRFVVPLAVALMSIAHIGVAYSQTGYGYSEVFTKYNTNTFDTSLRVISINEAIIQAGIYDSLYQISPVDDPMPFIKMIHTARHLERVHEYPIKPPGTMSVAEVAEHVVAYVAGAVEAICAGIIRNAFINSRPAGHHVLGDETFQAGCVFANAAIAAKYAQQLLRQQRKAGRILIVDWDRHHGNGNQALFYEDSTVLVFGMHQGTYIDDCTNINLSFSQQLSDGTNCAKGYGPGYGYNINAPLRLAWNADALAAHRELLVPACKEFKPEMIIISAGFDGQASGINIAGTTQPWLLTAKGFAMLTKIIMDIAEEYAGGRILSILEGGYGDFPKAPYADQFKGLSASAKYHVLTLLTGNPPMHEDLYFVNIPFSNPSTQTLPGGSFLKHHSIDMVQDIGLYNLLGQKVLALQQTFIQQRIPFGSGILVNGRKQLIFLKRDL